MQCGLVLVQKEEMEGDDGVMRAKVRRSQLTVDTQTKQRLEQQQAALDNMKPLSDEELAEARATLVEHMQPRETVMQAMARLSAKPGRSAPKVTSAPKLFDPLKNIKDVWPRPIIGVRTWSGVCFASDTAGHCCHEHGCVSAPPTAGIAVMTMPIIAIAACRNRLTESGRSASRPRNRHGWISSSGSQTLPAHSSALK